jgi:hypothetical protein
MTRSSILAWQRVHGDRAAQYAECAIGTFRTRTAGHRVVLTLNEVVIGNHGDQVRARHREHGGLYGPLAEEAGRETDGQTERASSEVKASTADGSDESPARLRSQETSVPTEPGPLSILIWGRPMRIDATWEELFAGRERGASDGKSLVAGSWAPVTIEAISSSSASRSRPTERAVWCFATTTDASSCLFSPAEMAISRNWPRRTPSRVGADDYFRAKEAVMPSESNVATLVPTKSDADLAAEFKKRAIEVYEPVLQLLNEANAAGFEIGIGSGLTPIGKHMITALRVAKVY